MTRQRKRQEISCVRCIINAVVPRNRLCNACRAAGWRWCRYGKHVVGGADVAADGRSCHACAATYSSRLKLKQRGAIVPEGYMKVGDYARKYHVDRTTVWHWARLNKIPNYRSPGGRHWVADVYVEVNQR
jgi:hypothetical protein